jgi:O-acetylserine/cysteine efflux transporter
MKPRHMVVAALVSVIWGFGFVVGIVALRSFSPPQLTLVRFVLACLPIVVVPRPRLPWSSIVLIGLTLFTGQFLLIFFAFTHGLPPGVASVSQQMQAFFTVALAAVFLRDIPTLRQCLGMTVAFVGLAFIGSTVGADLKPIGLGLGLGAALSWAVGNVLVKRTADVPMFPLVVWCSLIPPLPALAVSLLSGTDAGLFDALRHASWLGIGAVLYLGVLATVVAYATWGYLLQRYPTGAVAPFALLSPCTGVVASALIFGEVFSPARLAGMALILIGLAVIVLPANVVERIGWKAELRRS